MTGQRAGAHPSHPNPKYYASLTERKLPRDYGSASWYGLFPPLAEGSSTKLSKLPNRLGLREKRG